VAVDPESDERYPSGTVLIPADSPDASKLMSRAIDERKPMAIVFPDGSDVVARPPAATGAALFVVLSLLWLADHLRRKRDRPTFVPREWVTEFHAAGLCGKPHLVAWLGAGTRDAGASSSQRYRCSSESAKLLPTARAGGGYLLAADSLQELALSGM
jgi:hypothetical protein